MDKATSRLPSVEDLPPTGDGRPEMVDIPGQRTIEQVGVFLKAAPVHQIKTMAYMAIGAPARKDGAETIPTPVVVLLRGDHTLNLAKLSSLFPGVKEIRPMQPQEIENFFESARWLPGPGRPERCAPVNRHFGYGP